MRSSTGRKSPRSKRGQTKRSRKSKLPIKKELVESTVKGRTRKAKSANIATKAGQFDPRATEVSRGIQQLHQSAKEIHSAIEMTDVRIRRERKKFLLPSPAGKAGPGFRVVGIGASAGGFEAFTELLEELPPESGMAFVFVQHLDPAHESRLSSLLARATSMKVVEISDQTPVAPNRIYVIPPNTSLSISNRILRLAPRRTKKGQHLPIDAFFKSLAEDLGPDAIGIVLSGNANDGTEGLKAIKAEGGITFAQDEKSAKFPGMPRSAIAAGVDFVLSPGRIARGLERLADGAPWRDVEAKSGEPVLPGTEHELNRLFALLRLNTGVDFTHYKLTTLKRRILRRMILKKAESLRDYLDYLKDHPHEVEALFHDVLINVTGFFRDPGAFQTLKKKVFPRIVKRSSPEAPIRIWVPGCATGEEVYSLAICLYEFLGKNLNNRSVQIFGTDISNNMVARARTGIFPRSIASEVSPERLRRFFQKRAGGYQISKFIRDVCIFARQNVAEDPPFSKLDLISCRNLLIYLGLRLQQKVLPIFHYSLRPGGFLMLGTSETIGTFSNLFTLLDKRNKIYTRNEAYVRGEIEFTTATPAETAAPAPVGRTKAEPRHFDLQKRAEDILLSEFTPPGIIVNSRMEVLHFRGRIGPYLEPASGSASLNVLKMVRDELTVDLRTAIMQASKTNAGIRKEGIRLRNGQEISLDVLPFKNAPLPERFFLVLFRQTAEDSESTAPNRKEHPGGPRHRQAERETQRLREELLQTKDSLQTIIEEQEATNEELKSANEEIQSSNEELQSTNEELETAKEELQSTNEELTTLNEELQNRNGDLSQANNDLNNLISSFSMPIVMLSNDLTIRRFTPLAQKFFNLIPGDVGRRLTDINPNIPMPKLSQHVCEVIESLNMTEFEVQDREGHWYSLRIRPYRTADNKIEGAVLVLVDIGEIRMGLEEVTEIVPLPMLLLNADLRVSKANQAFYEKFKVTREETENAFLFRLGNGQWNNSALRTMLESILPANQKVENYRVENDFPHIGRRTFLLNARRLYQQSKGTHYILLLLQEEGGGPGELRG